MGLHPEKSLASIRALDRLVRSPMPARPMHLRQRHRSGGSGVGCKRSPNPCLRQLPCVCDHMDLKLKSYGLILFVELQRSTNIWKTLFWSALHRTGGVCGGAWSLEPPRRARRGRQAQGRAGCVRLAWLIAERCPCRPHCLSAWPAASGAEGVGQADEAARGWGAEEEAIARSWSSRRGGEEMLGAEQTQRLKLSVAAECAHGAAVLAV